MNNIYISIEAIGSCIPLLNLEVSNELTIEELYQRIREEFKIDHNIILFNNHNYQKE